MDLTESYSVLFSVPFFAHPFFAKISASNCATVSFTGLGNAVWVLDMA